MSEGGLLARRRARADGVDRAGAGYLSTYCTPSPTAGARRPGLGERDARDDQRVAIGLL